MNGLHLTDLSFAAVLLVVCALGSRYSDDPELSGQSSTTSKHYAGWQWFEQIEVGSWPILAKPRLHNVQVCALSVMYLFGTSTGDIWLLVGHGLKLVIDIGAHRRSFYSKPVTAEMELWKRAFWVLLCYDRITALSMSRPYALQEEDFDVDWPIECDDEYWDISSTPHSSRQPANVPSKITYFVQKMKLQQIYTVAIRTLHGAKTSRFLFEAGDPSSDSSVERQLLVRFDSALTLWLENVPDHLKWNHEQPDSLFFHQSALIHSVFYHARITIHRPYITRKITAPSLSSLAMCINAARANSYVLDAIVKRPLYASYPAVSPTAFSSAVMLVISMWDPHLTEGLSSVTIGPEDVERCLAYMSASETMIPLSGQFSDLIRELSSLGNAVVDTPANLGAVDHPNSIEQPSEDTLPVLMTQANSHAGVSLDTSSYFSDTRGAGLSFDSPAFNLSTNNDLIYAASELGLNQFTNTWRVPGPTFEQMLDNVSQALFVSDGSVPFETPSDTIANSEASITELWADAPSGFELRGWGLYLNELAGTHSAFSK